MSLKFYVWVVFLSQLCTFVQKPQTTLTLKFYCENAYISIGFITCIVFYVQNTVKFFFLLVWK